MRDIQIRPLRFLRRSRYGVYLPVNDKRPADPVARGSHSYMTADGYFLLRRTGEQWYISTGYNLVEDYPHLNRAFCQAGLNHARFPTRRAAAQALEAVMGASD